MKLHTITTVVDGSGQEIDPAIDMFLDEQSKEGKFVILSGSDTILEPNKRYTIKNPNGVHEEIYVFRTGAGFNGSYRVAEFVLTSLFSDWAQA